MSSLLSKIGFYLIKFGLDKILWKSAQKIVADVTKEFSNLSSEEKRREAVKRIEVELKREGKNIKEHLINLAIELAIKRIK